MEIFEQVESCIRKLTPCAATDAIHRNAHLVKDLGLSSFEMMVLLCDIEELHHISLDVSTVAADLTVAGMVSCIEQTISKRNADNSLD